MVGDPVTLAWYAADLKTGRIVEELRSLKPSGAISRKLGVSTSASFDLDLNGAPPGWEPATQEGRVLLVAVDTLTSTPVWSGIALTRAGGSSNILQLGAATTEAYFDRRYTGTYTGVQQDQAVIMTGVSSALLVDAPPFVFDAPNTGVLQDYSVLDGDDRTVLSVLQELMGQAGGAEWTVDTVWADAAQTTIQLVLRIRPQIGVVTATPEPVFDFPGCITSYVLSESYESDKGATTVLAYGDGEGASRLHSDVMTDPGLIDSGWCQYVYRYTPATGVTDPVQLNAHATEALAQMRTGTKAWTATSVASRSPRLGTDWALGDSVRIQVTASPRHPDGVETVARAYAWNLDVTGGADTVEPILVED